MTATAKFWPLFKSAKFEIGQSDPARVKKKI